MGFGKMGEWFACGDALEHESVDREPVEWLRTEQLSTKRLQGRAIRKAILTKHEANEKIAVIFLL